MRNRLFVVAGMLALLSSIGPAAGRAESLLQQRLDASPAYAALPKVAHVPQFSLERITPAEHAKDTDWFYILDGKERVGLIQSWTKEIEMFRFFPAGDGTGERYEIPTMYHWANLHGARIQFFGFQSLPPLKSLKVDWRKDKGDTLEFTVENRHGKDVVGTSDYRLTWDDRLGYVWQCVSRYSMPEPLAIEFNNLFGGGLSDSRPDHKRWQKTVRGLADGRIGFVLHSPINIPVNDIHAGGFVGFVTDDTMNPFIDLLETSEPTYAITCGQWYDQHVLTKPPQTKGADGLYRIEATYRFLSLPAAVAKEVEAAAVDTDEATGPSKKIGFLQNAVNDFEADVPRHQLYNGPTWHDVGPDEECAHSGKRSIKLEGQGPGKVKAAMPTGAGTAIYGESAKRYRFAAWVKTKGLADGGAYLQVDDVFWNWDDMRATRRTEKKLSGDHDWTRLEVEFTPIADDPFLLVKLCVEGTGTAWFDDVELVEVPVRAAP